MRFYILTRHCLHSVKNGFGDLFIEDIIDEAHNSDFTVVDDPNLAEALLAERPALKYKYTLDIAEGIIGGHHDFGKKSR